jgi:uncharacterized membrane protein YfcA
LRRIKVLTLPGLTAPVKAARPARARRRRRALGLRRRHPPSPYDFVYSNPVSAKTVLFALLGLLFVVFVVYWVLVERTRRASRATAGGAAPGSGPPPDGVPGGPRPIHLGLGFLTNFFDQLGIGSFATTTSLFKLGRVVDDRDIPGTLNVGHALPTLAEALISIALIQVEMRTLVALIAASVLGAYLGAGVVAGWSRRRIQIGMGILLLVAATIIVVRQTGSAPGGGTALGIDGGLLALGFGANFVLGALMTLGIGLFAPCMIMVSLLGMNPKTAFPIMMGSCAFLMPAASFRFIKSGRYNLRAAVGLTLGGVPAVLIAAYLVQSLPLAAVQWLVVLVVVYTAVTLLRSAHRAR